MTNLGNLANKQILRLISEISFDSLRKLNLSGNNIESVEVFHRIRMPLIEELRIFNELNAQNLNYVTDISQLRKIYFPNFNQLSIRRN